MKPKEDILLKHILTDKQLDNIFIKPLDESIFWQVEKGGKYS